MDKLQALQAAVHAREAFGLSPSRLCYKPRGLTSNLEGNNSDPKSPVKFEMNQGASEENINQKLDNKELLKKYSMAFSIVPVTKLKFTKNSIGLESRSGSKQGSLMSCSRENGRPEAKSSTPVFYVIFVCSQFIFYRATLHVAMYQQRACIEDIISRINQPTRTYAEPAIQPQLTGQLSLGCGRQGQLEDAPRPRVQTSAGNTNGKGNQGILTDKYPSRIC